jgi:peptidase E
MPADEPTILATSGGIRSGQRVQWEFAPLITYAVELAGVTGRAPRICGVMSALGDNPEIIRNFYDAANTAKYSASHLALIPMPNVEDVRARLLEQDVIWVCGGSVAALLALWRLHGVDLAMADAWQAGVVLTGVSAGSLCWHQGGTTDSFGPTLRPVTNGLGLIPLSNGVHYDGEEQRRPLYHQLVTDGTLGAGYATDNGVGVLYRGTEFAEAVTEVDGRSAYWVERGPDGQAIETELTTRRLPGAA